jgi:hypothetical protein
MKYRPASRRTSPKDAHKPGKLAGLAGVALPIFPSLPLSQKTSSLPPIATIPVLPDILRRADHSRGGKEPIRMATGNAGTMPSEQG